MSKKHKFAELDDAVQANIAQHFSRFRSFEADETIIHKGDDSSHVYFILNGRVRITNFSDKGREIWHTELGPGTFLGEMSALSGTTRTSYAIAQATTELAVLSQDEFFKLIRHDPDIAIWIMQELVRRIGEQTEKMSSLIGHKVTERIRAAILRIARESEFSTGEELVIRPVPNISELALKLNTDRETVSRELSNLHKLAIIDKRKACITVLKPDQLDQYDIT